MPRLQLSIAPTKGTALVFNDVLDDGYEDERTEHAGTPPSAGVKYAINLWIRAPPPGTEQALQAYALGAGAFDRRQWRDPLELRQEAELGKPKRAKVLKPPELRAKAAKVEQPPKTPLPSELSPAGSWLTSWPALAGFGGVIVLAVLLYLVLVLLGFCTPVMFVPQHREHDDVDLSERKAPGASANVQTKKHNGKAKHSKSR